eukprot:GABV01003827.1.p1 GENE.GABV01003827.1~~GABV01003827.1.p1  ORF type:complete len:172 (-),score=30.16 GABV01003827.1:7-522(-)
MSESWSFTATSDSARCSSKPPPGFLSGDFSWDSDSSASSRRAGDPSELVYRAAMAAATSPFKQLLMTALMLYMSGNSIQIFSIVMVGMATWQPLKALLGVRDVFAKYENNSAIAGSDVSFLLPKLIYVGAQLLAFSMAAWKLSSLGLIGGASFDHVSPPQGAEVIVESVSF